jgi:hypothetical protein
MTLVIAERKNNLVSIIADSRFNYGGTTNFDFGIKVSPLRIKIRSPNETDGSSTVDYDHLIGVGVTGSVIAAATIKEYMAAALVNIQYTPGYTDFSFEGIVSFIAKFYEKICFEMSVLFREKGICEMVMAGFCPAQERIRCFYLTMDVSDYPIKIVCKEILEGDGIVFFGSGKIEASKVQIDHPNYSALNIVRRVIFDGKNPTVGGSIQLGNFNNNNFVVTGLMIDNPTADNPSNCDWNLWGINHLEGNFDIDDESFLLNIGFLMVHDIVDFTTEAEQPGTEL